MPMRWTRAATPTGRHRRSCPSAQRRRRRRRGRDRPREPGPATAAPRRAPTGRGSGRPGPCRGGAACTRPGRTRRRTGRGSRGNASRSPGRPGRSSARCPSWPSSVPCASTDRARPAPPPGPRGSSDATAGRRPGSSTVPSRSRRGCRRSRCPTGSGCSSTHPRGRWRSCRRPCRCRSCPSSRGACWASGAPSGSSPTYLSGSAAPWALPNV